MQMCSYITKIIFNIKINPLQEKNTYQNNFCCILLASWTFRAGMTQPINSEKFHLLSGGGREDVLHTGRVWGEEEDLIQGSLL